MKSEEKGPACHDKDTVDKNFLFEIEPFFFFDWNAPSVWGLIFAILSVLSAAIVEAARLAIMERGGNFTQEFDGVTVLASDLTITFLIPQYIFMAVADILIFVTGKEFSLQFKKSCCGSVDETTDSQLWGPRFESAGSGSSAFGQGTLSSLPNPSERT